ncbi:MAG TPA: YcaO-like family protein [Acetobacteraceae bacterium]|nr:YcaO-like family protein [Acetobacteraceae bacterium]
MLRAAAGFHRIFTLPAEDAPGLVALGAEVDPGSVGAPDLPLGSVSGTGLTFRHAFEACVGEGVEYLAQFATPHDPIEYLTADEALTGAPPRLTALWHDLQPFRRNEAARTAWTIAAALADGGAVRLPADLCFRRAPDARDIDPPWPLSTGCGAGTDHLHATLHGLLELIERDAVSLWWRGGRRGRMLPPGLGAAVLAQLRGGRSGRQTWLLDVTSDIGVPVVVAASCGSDGYSLCCGHAAGPTLGAAADRAMREMTQMELAARLAAIKRSARGEAALNETDRQHLRRFTTIDVATTPALQPLAPPSPPRDLPTEDPLATLAELRRRLAAAGLAPCALNLTRAAFDIPVTRVVCPGLEQGMTSPPGSRLLQSAKLAGIDPIAIAPL